MENLITNTATLITLIGVIAFMVSIITEVTKNIGFLKRIPTDLQVVGLSLILCVIAYFAYCSYANILVEWYFVVAVVILSFLVAFVAMYGWTKLSETWERFKK